MLTQLKARVRASRRCMADLADVLGRDEALGERKVARVHLSLPL